jgi:hypothetical protein
MSAVIYRYIAEFFLRYINREKQKISVEQLAGHLSEIKISAANIWEVLYED